MKRDGGNRTLSIVALQGACRPGAERSGTLDPSSTKPLRRQEISVMPTPQPYFDVASQSAGSINNVAHDQYYQRDQYNQYVSQVIQQRESFAREIAATKTKARWLVWIGLTLLLAGGGFYYWAFMKFSDFSDFTYSSEVSSEHWFHLMQIGVGVASIGVVTIVVGVVLHIVAASRKRSLMVMNAPIAPPGWSEGVGR
jgi:hypothetical protein